MSVPMPPETLNRAKRRRCRSPAARSAALWPVTRNVPVAVAGRVTLQSGLALVKTRKEKTQAHPESVGCEHARRIISRIGPAAPGSYRRAIGESGVLSDAPGG